MSTSLLYHGFSIHQHKYLSTHYSGGKIFFNTEQKERLSCPSCGSKEVIKSGSKKRVFRHLPIGFKPTFICWNVPRVKCHKCGSVQQVKIDFAQPKKSYTKAFARYILEFLQCATIKDVARNLKMSWNTIKDIEKTHLLKHYSKPRLKDVKRIAIDEFAIQKGHKYMTVVIDLDSGAIIHVGKGKDAAALNSFWKRLKHSKAKIEAVATDMSPAYLSAVRENLSKAKHVLDHFHVVKLFNDKISTLRREVYNQTEDKAERKILKGTRWLLLKNTKNLNFEKGEDSKLIAALTLNKPLYTAYYLKEELKLIWQQDSREDAEQFFDQWIKMANTSGVKILKDFADTLVGHREEILNYYDCPISTGPLEGINNKIKTLKRRAYGYRDLEFFKLKLYSMHEQRLVFSN